MHEVESNEGNFNSMREVKAIMTLRSGKKINRPSLPILHEEVVEGFTCKEQGNAHSEDKASKNQTKQPERMIIREGNYAHLT